MGHHPEMAGQTLCPSFLKRFVVFTPDINAVHRASHDVKTGRKNDGIDLDFPVADNNTVLGEVRDGAFIQIN